MKKSISLYEQVKAAKTEVDSWPESVKSATSVDYQTSVKRDKETSQEENPVVQKDAALT